MTPPPNTIVCGDLKMSRVWAMPTSETFQCPPIRDFVRRWVKGARVIVDPFARNCPLADPWTNDLNPKTRAKYHLDVLAFLLMLRDQGLSPDVVIYDPPYSPRQVKECYNGIGIATIGARGALRTAAWKEERDVIHSISRPGAVCLSFGWNSCGMGTGRGWRQEEILLVCHSSGHSDTICMAERRIRKARGLPLVVDDATAARELPLFEEKVP